MEAPVSRLRRSVRPISLLVVGIVGVWYVTEHRTEFRLLLEAKLGYLPALLAVPLLTLLVNGRIMQFLVRYFGVQLSSAEAYVLTTMHAFANYLPIPQAGAMARGVYLKRVHGLAYGRFAATVLVTYVQFLLGVGAVGLATLALLGATGEPSPVPLWLLFAGLAAGGLAFPRLARAKVLVRRFGGLAGPIRSLLGMRTTLIVSGHQALLIGLHAVGLWMAFAALGRPLPLDSTLLLSLVSMASGVINVTPGNLGVAESAAWVTARVIGADPDIAVVAYTLFRLTSVIIIFVLTPIFAARFRAATGTRHQATAGESEATGRPR